MGTLKLLARQISKYAYIENLSSLFQKPAKLPMAIPRYIHSDTAGTEILNPGKIP